MNELEKRVKEIIEKNGGQEFAEQVMAYGCISGLVNELTTYAQAHEWFDTYYDDIMELVEEYEAMMGERIHWQGDLKNWFAWFSFEETTRKLYS